MTLQQHPINQFKTEQMCNHNHWHECGSKANYRNASYRGADKSLVQPTSRIILFNGDNIYFDASLVIYIYKYIYIYTILIFLQLW